ELLLQRHVVFGAKVARKERARRARLARVVEVHVRVARALRESDLHFFLPFAFAFFTGAAGFGTASPAQNPPPRCASATRSPGVSGGSSLAQSSALSCGL